MRQPVVLGLDFGGTKIATAVNDLAGARLGSATVHLRSTDSAQTTLDRGIAAAQGLLASLTPGHRLAAVGACTFGIPGEDSVALAPTVPGWSELAFGRQLRGAFQDAEIVLATDVKAAAQAEVEWGALAGCDTGVYLNLGTGLATAIVVNGSVLSGRNGAAGEIGYHLRSLADVGVPAPRRVPLEEAVSGKALLSRALELHPGAGNAADLFAAAGDADLTRLLSEFIRELAYHLVNLAITIDPARIVVGGGMVRSWDRLYGGLRDALDAAVPFPPELMLAQFPFDAPLMGALALAAAAAKQHLPEATTV